MTATDKADTALRLLRFMVTVEQWVKDGDERAKPYLDADAVRLFEDGKVGFHRDRFLDKVAELGVFEP